MLSWKKENPISRILSGSHNVLQIHLAHVHASFKTLGALQTLKVFFSYRRAGFPSPGCLPPIVFLRKSNRYFKILEIT